MESAHHLRATFEPGQPLPLERGASGGVLLGALAPQTRPDYLALLAQRSPEAATRVEQSAIEAAERGSAASEEEIDRGVWAASAAVTTGGPLSRR